MSDRASVVRKLQGYGEAPPHSWTLVQLRARLQELKETEAKDTAVALEQELAALKRASKKKSILIEHLEKLRDEKLSREISSNKTISQLYNHGVEAVTRRFPPHGSELVAFGKFAYLTYRELRRDHAEYAAWIQKTSVESDSPHWRLLRLASWLNAAANAKEDSDEELVRDKGRQRSPLGRSIPKSASPSKAASSRAASSRAVSSPGSEWDEIPSAFDPRELMEAKDAISQLRAERDQLKKEKELRELADAKEMIKQLKEEKAALEIRVSESGPSKTKGRRET